MDFLFPDLGSEIRYHPSYIYEERNKTAFTGNSFSKAASCLSENALLLLFVREKTEKEFGEENHAVCYSNVICWGQMVEMLVF